MSQQPPPEKKKRNAEDDPGWHWMLPRATFCDYFILEAYEDSSVVRIAFGDWLDKETSPLFRHAIVLPIADAKMLAKRLGEAIQEAESGHNTKADEKESDGDK